MKAAKGTAPTTDTGRVVARFAGDSGDGIQLLGGQFAQATARNQHDLITFSDFPAEIRAPKGTLAGVSAFQIQFGGPVVLTAGDQVDVLVALNPAALKMNLPTLRRDGLLIVDTETFNDRELSKAGYESNPLNGAATAGFRVLQMNLTSITRDAVVDCGVKKKDSDRSKNFCALGVILWVFDLDREKTVAWVKSKFAGSENIVAANLAALNAGHTFGEAAELADYPIPQAQRAHFDGGTYRSVSGIDALVYGLAAASVVSDRDLCFCSYPITPASGILHGLTNLQATTIHTFQAEDEIAAAGSALGASYAGAIGVTASSGPGIALKSETISLAVGVELPLVIINVQRAGPSTGMPTKTEQADLGMALYGRHGEAPIAVLAPATPGECFDMVIEAVRIAIDYMTPVMLLADGFIANAAEPWSIPVIADIPPIVPLPPKNDTFLPYRRDPETFARPWAAPGLEGYEHRIGGIERSAETGNISYEPDNHQAMTDNRAAKISAIANAVAPVEIERGAAEGNLAIVSWGSTYGPANAAVNELIKEGHAVSHIQIRHLSPLPRGLQAMLQSFEHVLVAEMNSGQLRQLLRAEFLVPAVGLNQINGKPFKVATIKTAALKLMESGAAVENAFGDNFARQAK